MKRSIFVHSRHASDFSKDIQALLAIDYDLYGGLVQGVNEIGQWVIEGKSFYEYRLVIANSADSLDALVDGYVSDGWDFFQGTILFGGDYCQWMCKEAELNISKSKSVSVVPEDAPMKREPLSVVVDATPVLRIEPTTDEQALRVGKVWARIQKCEIVERMVVDGVVVP